MTARAPSRGALYTLSALVLLAAVIVFSAAGARNSRPSRGDRKFVASGPSSQRHRVPPPPTTQLPTQRESGFEPFLFDISVSGDLLLHGPIVRRAYGAGSGRYDFRPMFAAIRPILRRSRLAICHVETPIGAGAPSGYPLFNAPRELVTAIRWAGWDACSTASNHSLDRGGGGVISTRRALISAGVHAVGTARTQAQRLRPLLLRVGSVRVAFLAYTYGTNGLRPPHPWSVNVISRRAIVRDALAARAAGADLVLLNLHWGDEYSHRPNEQQDALARFLLRRGIVDVIVGQHAHVVQPIRRLFGRFIVFGEGNLLSNQTAACCPSESQDGLIAILRVRASSLDTRVERVDYVPIRVRHPDFRVEPVGAALAGLINGGDRSGPEASALRHSYRTTVAYAGRSSVIRPIPRALPRG